MSCDATSLIRFGTFFRKFLQAHVWHFYNPFMCAWRLVFHNCFSFLFSLSHKWKLHSYKVEIKNTFRCRDEAPRHFSRMNTSTIAVQQRRNKFNELYCRFNRIENIFLKCSLCYTTQRLWLLGWTVFFYRRGTCSLFSTVDALNGYLFRTLWLNVLRWREWKYDWNPSLFNENNFLLWRRGLDILYGLRIISILKIFWHQLL